MKTTATVHTLGTCSGLGTWLVRVLSSLRCGTRTQHVPEPALGQPCCGPAFPVAGPAYPHIPFGLACRGDSRQAATNPMRTTRHPIPSPGNEVPPRGCGRPRAVRPASRSSPRHVTLDYHPSACSLATPCQQNMSFGKEPVTVHTPGPCAGPGIHLVRVLSSQRLRNSHATYAGADFPAHV